MATDFFFFFRKVFFFHFTIYIRWENLEKSNQSEKVVHVHWIAKYEWPCMGICMGGLKRRALHHIGSSPKIKIKKTQKKHIKGFITIRTW